MTKINEKTEKKAVPKKATRKSGVKKKAKTVKPSAEQLSVQDSEDSISGVVSGLASGNVVVATSHALSTNAQNSLVAQQQNDLTAMTVTVQGLNEIFRQGQKRVSLTLKKS
ncbi:RebB family R body protein [Photobacterium lipolyticum]|uniref:Glycerol-3-phosphate dehydrogenase subunit C n=1 Tax=Photobacterium lipolyticum TaxID=266810 RepID=A0A2T3N464_9GAMM|nr:RebB family R body protein [Photobacterium lipolyticum]PSW07155.1 hypothetical protein C9I89_00015 [Photobacterium lipolyticum]